MGQLICKIDGVIVQAPQGWQGVQTLMTWDNESVQANITTTKFTFVADAAKAIKDHVTANGYFTALPITFEDYEDNGSSFVFNGYIDFTDGYKELTPTDETLQFKVECTIKERNQIDTFKAKAMGTTWALLEERGIITASDFSKLLYVIQKPYDPLETLMIEVQLVQTTIVLQGMIKDVAIDTANAIAHLSGGLTGPIAVAIFAVAVAIIEVIYVVIIIIQLISLLNKLLQIFLPMPRFGRVLSIRQYLELACEGLGYTFSSSITDINTLYIFPSKDKVIDNNPFNSSTTDTGYFDIKDFGYIVGEALQIFEKLLYAKFKIDTSTNTVHFEPLKNDSFWLTQSTYQMEDVYIDGWRPNIEDIAGTRVVKFQTDDYDVWTKENYSGTAHEIHTRVAIISNERDSLIKGYDEIGIELALGNQKETKNSIEIVLSQMVGFINDIANTVGVGVPPIISAYQHIGKALKIEQDQTKNAKLVRAESATIAGGTYLLLKNNQRTNCSAQYFYDNYIIEKSFVYNGGRNQWRIFENIRVPFSRSSFVAIGNNNYFYNASGKVCRMDKVEWEHDKDFAIVSYRQRKRYDSNLIEKVIVI